MNVNVVIRRCLIGIVLAVALVNARAQPYPAKPIRIVAGYPAGGSADLLARLVADKLNASLGQTVVVENRAGAAGTIAAEAVAKSAGDGYTLLLGPASSQSIGPSVYTKLGYDVERDFKPITLLATIPIVLVVHPSLNAQSPKDLSALARSRSLSFASTGNAGMSHLITELYQMEQQVRMVHVPYKGAPPAMADLISGRVDLMFDHAPTVLPHIRSGKLRALGIAGAERARALPEVPTLTELGLPGLEVSSWFGLVAPAATPDPIIALLNREVVRAMASDDAKARLDAMGADGRTTTPEAFGRLIREDTARWARVVKQTGARAD